MRSSGLLFITVIGFYRIRGDNTLLNNNNITINNEGIIYGNNLEIGTHNFIIQYEKKMVYTSRFERVILAQGPC